MLRSSGNTYVPSLLNILMCLLDVVFNFLLIFPPRQWHGLTLPGAGLGVLGAVVGTACAYVICSLAMCWFACVRSPQLSLLIDRGRFLPTADTLRRAFRIALPMGVEHFIMCAAQIVSTIIVAPLGTVAIAANSFGITVESLCYMPGYGISDAATTLVGQSLGARRSRLARSFGRITLMMGIAVMTVMGVVMYVTAPALMTLMTPDETVRQLTVECLRIEAFAEPGGLRNLHRSRRHARALLDEPAEHLGRAHHPGQPAGLHPRPTRRMDSHGRRALLPRRHLPHPLPQRKVDGPARRTTRPRRLAPHAGRGNRPARQPRRHGPRRPPQRARRPMGAPRTPRITPPLYTITHNL